MSGEPVFITARPACCGYLQGLCFGGENRNRRFSERVTSTQKRWAKCQALLSRSGQEAWRKRDWSRVPGVNPGEADSDLALDKDSRGEGWTGDTGCGNKVT